ncbi:phosphoribosyltransferase [Rhizobium ruizarguesonis]
MTYYPIFRRLSDRIDKGQGDNCPFIYAAKKKDGLRLTYTSLKELHPDFEAIISHVAASGAIFQYLIPIPSAHRINEFLGTRFRRAVPHVAVIDSLLAKATIASALEAVDALTTSAAALSDIRTLRSALRRLQKAGPADQLYASKEIKADLRKYVHPLRLLPAVPPNDVQHIMLVDDLISSGTSVLCARDLLRTHFPNAEFSVLALFGPLNGKLRR